MYKISLKQFFYSSTQYSSYITHFYIYFNNVHKYIICKDDTKINPTCKNESHILSHKNQYRYLLYLLSLFLFLENVSIRTNLFVSRCNEISTNTFNKYLFRCVNFHSVHDDHFIAFFILSKCMSIFFWYIRIRHTI